MFKDNIAVIGLGMAGLPLAAVIASNKIKVVGIDPNKARCELINKGLNPIAEEPNLEEIIKNHGGKNLIASPSYKDAEDCTVYIIIVPLFIDENHLPDYNHLKQAILNVGRMLKKNDIVVIETTVPPGTTETLIKDWLESESGMSVGEFYLAHSPERIMTGYSISRLREFPKVIGGVNIESGEKAYNVYKNFIPHISLVSSARVAEFIKVMEGCYRDVNIALANELFKIADELGIDFAEAREHANHTYCNIHFPSTGVGGHCIPYYPWFLIHKMEGKGKYSYTSLLKASRALNDEMLYYWMNKVLLSCLEINKPLGLIKICINGITFRKGVKSTHYSRNLALATLLKNKGLDVYAFDELLSKKEIEDLGLKYLEPESADLVFNSFDLKISMNAK